MLKYIITQTETLNRVRTYEIEALNPSDAFNKFYDGGGKLLYETTHGDFKDTEFKIKESKING